MVTTSFYNKEGWNIRRETSTIGRKTRDRSQLRSESNAPAYKHIDDMILVLGQMRYQEEQMYSSNLKNFKYFLSTDRGDSWSNKMELQKSFFQIQVLQGGIIFLLLTKYNTFSDQSTPWRHYANGYVTCNSQLQSCVIYIAYIYIYIQWIELLDFHTKLLSSQP